MPDPGEQHLLLSDWLVLCVVCEKPVHGFAVAGLFPPASDEFPAGQPSVLSGCRDRPLSIGGPGWAEHAGSRTGAAHVGRPAPEGAPVSGRRARVGPRKGALVPAPEGKRA